LLGGELWQGKVVSFEVTFEGVMVRLW